jgi:hypothetical protein
VVWVVGADRWNQADPRDPRKMLAQEVAATLKARTRWASRNGAGAESSERDSSSNNNGNDSPHGEESKP